MKIMDFLSSEAVTVALKGPTKKEAITELAALLQQAKKIKSIPETVKILMERETLGSTGIGQGIAIPHGKSPEVSEIVAAFGVAKGGVDFESLDGEPVYLVFLLVAPPDAQGEHLKALAKISRLLKDKFFRQALREAEDAKEVLKIIGDEDAV